MIPRAIFLLIGVLAGGILACGCKGPHRLPGPDFPQKRPAPSSLGSVPAEPRAEAFARYAAGISHELSGQPEQALEEYLRAAKADPSQSKLVIETAHRLLQANRTQPALELLQKAAGHPQAPGDVHAMLARAYIQSGETNAAIIANQTAIRKNPQALGAYMNLADIYFHLGHSKEMLKILDQGAKQPMLEPAFPLGFAELYFKYAQAHPGELAVVKPKAAQLLMRAADLNPDSPTLLQKIADLLVQAGERKRAAEIYGQLLEKYADLPLFRDLLRERLANLYLQESDKHRAAELLEAMVRDNPTKHPHVFYVLGTLAFEQKKFERAAEHFNRALLINPEMEQAYYDLAGSQINLNKTAEALKILNKAREKFSQSFIGEFYSGLAHHRRQNYAEAVRHFTAAEIIAGAGDRKLDHLFYFQVGASHERNKDYEQAEKFFQKALELRPDDAETLNYLGYMWADRGVNLEKARQLIEQAVKLDPKNAAYLDSLGWVLYKLNQPAAALDYLLMAIEFLGEPDATIYDHLGDVYFALSLEEKAREAWRKSLQIEPNDEVKKKLGISL